MKITELVAQIKAFSKFEQDPDIVVGVDTPVDTVDYEAATNLVVLNVTEPLRKKWDRELEASLLPAPEEPAVPTNPIAGEKPSTKPIDPEKPSLPSKPTDPIKPEDKPPLLGDIKPPSTDKPVLKPEPTAKDEKKK